MARDKRHTGAFGKKARLWGSAATGKQLGSPP